MLSNETPFDPVFYTLIHRDAIWVEFMGQCLNSQEEKCFILAELKREILKILPATSKKSRLKVETVTL